MKKILLWLVLFLIFFFQLSFAESDDFVLIPEAKDSGKVENVIEKVGSEPGQVWQNYNSGYNSIKNDLGAQIATGVMGWDTIILFLKYLIKRLSQLGMVIGALMIIYAGYTYATAVFTGNSTKGIAPVKNAILGVILIISSYAIMKILINLFL